MKAILPLSTRMRPESIDAYVGQKTLLAEGMPFRKAIDKGKLPSFILWGPPGCGKTTLARIIAKKMGTHFDQLSAVNAGLSQVREIIANARQRIKITEQGTILFLDEIHRFSKSQQDSLLPYIEEGDITLIGATTENPSFTVIAPLLSRVRIYTLEPMTDDDMRLILERAMQDETKGLGKSNTLLDDDALLLLIKVANGDARTALDTLELAASTTREQEETAIIKADTIAHLLQRRARYDRLGDAHYDTISAFIKSIRSSDPDAALYYLARMIDAGEDPLFIARRLVISAAEDVGLANPHALVLASATQQAVHLIGMPEGRIPLAEATIYLASSPKSNSAYLGIERAAKHIRNTKDEPIPLHLRNAPTRLMKELGYGKEYKYAHDYPGSFTHTENLPERLRGSRYYTPGNNAVEDRIASRLRNWWNKRYDNKTE